jgi:redox-sensitive bicupin YhaK (pirin superfamily)
MITLRPAQERGHTEIGWLDSRHSFSFGDYMDPQHISFGPLRVINDDRVAPGAGFGMHPHCDMEIITYVLDGELEHRDSMGNGAVLHPGDVQVMTAGTGIVHSEFNPSEKSEVRLVQIWIMPEKRGLTPGYADHSFEAEAKPGELRLVASKNPHDGALKINQDANVFVAKLEPARTLKHELQPGRSAWLQVLRGTVKLNGKPLIEGDGAAVKDERALELSGDAGSEVLLFDLP